MTIGVKWVVFQFHLTLCTFSFENKESSPSYPMCLIQDRRWSKYFQPNDFVMTLYWNACKNTSSMQRKQSDCLMFIHSYYESQIYGHIHISKDIVSIFQATVRSAFLKKKRCQMIARWHWKWLNNNVTLVNERQQITWRHAQNVVSLRVLCKFNLNLVICLKFVFI